MFNRLGVQWKKVDFALNIFVKGSVMAIEIESCDSTFYQNVDNVRRLFYLIGNLLQQ